MSLSYLSLKDKNFFRPESGVKILKNEGEDPRKRTLVEYVVNELARETDFLRTRERKEREIKRLSQHASNWLDRLNCIDNLILNDITLDNANKKYRIRVNRKTVEANTGAYIRDLLTEFQNFVNSNNKEKDEYLVILLGDGLNNQFIRKRFAEKVGEQNLYIGKSLQLDEVLAVYKDAYECFKSNIDGAELKNRYSAAIAKGDKRHKHGELESAKSFYLEAKNLISSDEIITKLELINELLKNEEKNIKDFSLLLKEAEKLIEVGNFHKAISKFDDALELSPENEDVYSRRNTITLQIQLGEQKANNLYKDAQAYIREQKYSDAVDTLTSVLEIDSNHAEARNLLVECKNQIAVNKILEKGNQHFKNFEFEKAKMIFQEGLPDEICIERIEKCDSLLSLVDPISDMLMQAKDALNSDNLEIASNFLKKSKESIARIREIDKSLEPRQLDKLYTSHSTIYKKKQRFVYQTLVKQGNSSMLNKNFEEAEGFFKKALQIVENDSLCLTKIEEIQSLNEKQKVNRKRYDELLTKGTSSIENGALLEANEYLNAAIKLFPNEKEAVKLRDEISFRLLELKNKFNLAIKKGIQFYNHKDYPSAKQHFENAKKLQAKNPEVLEYLKKLDFHIQFPDEQIEDNSKSAPGKQSPVKQDDPFTGWTSKNTKSKEPEHKRQQEEKTNNTKPRTKNKKPKTSFDF